VIFDGLDPDETSFVLRACEDEKLFKQYVIADIFKRNRRCASHAKDIRQLKLWRAVQASVGGMVLAIGAWLASQLWGKS